MAFQFCTRCGSARLPYETDWVRHVGLWFCEPCQVEVKRLLDVSAPSGVSYATHCEVKPLVRVGE